MQKMSYQMINSLEIDIMPNVVEESKKYWVNSGRLKDKILLIIIL